MTELTDRMRTWAAFIMNRYPDEYDTHEEIVSTSVRAIREAAKLMTEAADELEKPIEVRLGELIPILPPAEPSVQPKALWVGDDLKPIPNQPLSRNACPKCDSRATKTVHASKAGIRLECPVCGHKWKR